MLDQKSIEEVKQIINNKIKIEEDTGCHIWTGSYCEQRKSCRLTFKQTSYQVNRLVWTINNMGVILKKSERCLRSCNNNKCVNYNHLIIKDKNEPLTKEDMWERILKDSEKQEAGCILYTKNINVDGYGRIEIANKKYRVHCLAWWVNSNLEKMPTKEETDRYIVRHMCKERSCVNPDHLKIGTQLENCKDKLESGTQPKGETHHSSSITRELAQKIQSSKYEKSHPNYKTKKKRAEQYGVSLYIIKQIDQGITWGHIEGSTFDVDKHEERRKKERERYLKRKDKIWTKEMFEKAHQKLINNSTEMDEPNEFTKTKCRIWNLSKNNFGYGRMSIFGKEIRSHIMACEIREGRHRKKEEITRHLCNNKLCCEPTHVKFGSQSENSIDQLRHGKKNSIPENVVLDIRETYKKDGLTNIERAKKYNIGVQSLRAIQNRKTYKHIQ
jgi:transcriptional regulator of met regulon